MRSIVALMMNSMLALVTLTCQATGLPINYGWHPSVIKDNALESQMFEGIILTEHQRQQMRDLMQQTQVSLARDVRDMEVMHRLVIASSFDEVAVRVQAEKMAQQEINRQVEMAKVRNQMFRILTPQQRTTLDNKFQQRMNQLRELADLRQVPLLQIP